jgi:succinate dehydrogenase / fumarate reductase, flavoprotein subunit
MAEDKYETHEYDVVVIGAGGAGLRARSRLRRMGAKTALVCKSLLGKAHTVMAEGGIAAAMGNVYRRTTGRSTSATPCAAARCSTTGAWRSCTPRRRRTASSSSRSGARCSTAPRTADPQRDFGGHRYARSPTSATAPAWR